MDPRDVKRVQVGSWFIAVAGSLYLFGIVLRGQFVFPTPDPAAWAAANVTTANIISQYSQLFGVIALVLGVIALYGFLRETAVERLAFLGLLNTVTGSAILMAFMGVGAFVDPIIAELYLQNVEEAIAVSEAVYSGTTLGLGIVSSILSVVGAFYFARAMWQSGLFPRLAPLLYMLQSLGVGFGFLLWGIEIAGCLLLAISGGIIAITIRRYFGHQAVEGRTVEPERPLVTN